MCWMITSNDLDDEDLGVAHRRWLLLQVATYPTRWQVPPSCLLVYKPIYLFKYIYIGSWISIDVIAIVVTNQVSYRLGVLKMLGKLLGVRIPLAPGLPSSC
jgi:hypothetical protein